MCFESTRTNLLGSVAILLANIEALFELNMTDDFGLNEIYPSMT